MSRNMRDRLKREIYSRNDSRVSELLGNYAMDAEALNKKVCGETPLHWASRNNPHAMGLILAKPGIDVNIRDKHGYTPLHTAIQNKNLQGVTKLLNHPGIDLNAKSNAGCTVLYMASVCLFNFPSILEKLISSPGIDLNVEYSGKNLLHSACSVSNHDMIRLLLANPEVDINSKSDDGKTPLHELCASKSPYWVSRDEGLKMHEKALKLMLEDSRIDLNCKDKDGDGLEVFVFKFYSSKEDEERRDKCLEMIQNERFKRDARRKKREQESRNDITAQCVEKIGKMKRKLDEEDKRKSDNLNIREGKRQCLSKKQSWEKDALDRKQLEEKTSLDKKHIEEKAILEGTFVREDVDMERYMASLKESMEDLNNELVKLTNSSDIGASSKDQYRLDAATSSLECPVCMEPMRPPTRIWMCSRTHIICEDCRDQLDGGKCPTCTTERVTLRAYVIEKMARSLFN